MQGIDQEYSHHLRMFFGTICNLFILKRNSSCDFMPPKKYVLLLKYKSSSEAKLKSNHRINDIQRWRITWQHIL